MVLPQIFKGLPVWLWVLLLGGCAAALFVAPQSFGIQPARAKQMAGGAILMLVLIVASYFAGKSKAAGLAKSIARSLQSARRIHVGCTEKTQVRHTQEIQRIETEAKGRTQMFQQKWKTALEEAGKGRDLWPQKVDEKFRLVSRTHERVHNTRLQRMEQEHTAIVERLKGDAQTRQDQL